MDRREEKLANSKFQVGDKVIVVDEPFYSCPFDWADEMDEFCGNEVTIDGFQYFPWCDALGYFIDEDNGNFTWCENCFAVPIPDIEESDADISFLIP